MPSENSSSLRILLTEESPQPLATLEYTFMTSILFFISLFDSFLTIRSALADSQLLIAESILFLSSYLVIQLVTILSRLQLALGDSV